MKQSQKQKKIARKDQPTATKPITRNDPVPATKPVAKLEAAATPQPGDLSVLPIEGATMPTDDVSDLRDVVDAINRLCETMKTSDYDARGDGNDTDLCENNEIEVKVESDDLVSPEQIVISEVETYVAELWSDAASLHASVEAAADSPTREDTVSTLVLESYRNTIEDDVPVVPNRLSEVEHKDAILINSSLDPVSHMDKVASDSVAAQAGNVNVVTHQPVSRVESAVFVASDPVVFDQELITASIEPVSEMYYTASSEVSLLSDVELADRIQEEVIEEKEAITRDDRNGVMAGHVAAMRERFESMTRANTPCPDVMRSVSPSLDVYRNITPSPDHLG